MNSIEIEQYLIEHKNIDYDEAIIKADELDGMSFEEVDKVLESDVRQTCKTNNVRQEKVIIPDVLQGESDVRQTCKTTNTTCKTTLTVRLEEDLKKEIKAQADELGMSTSSLIRDVLQTYFDK